MNILTLIYTRSILFVQVLLVMTFVIFEELVWDVFAKPVYEYISKLEILKSLQKKLEHTNRYLILVIFVLLFATVEAAGVYAGVLLLQGNVLPAVVLYISKIPIAAFTFWLFGVTKDKLLSFDWFRWLYNKIISAFEWVKHTRIYQDVKISISHIKSKIKLYKTKLSSGESKILRRYKGLYKRLKQRFKAN